MNNQLRLIHIIVNWMEEYNTYSSLVYATNWWFIKNQHEVIIGSISDDHIELFDFKKIRSITLKPHEPDFFKRLANGLKRRGLCTHAHLD